MRNTFVRALIITAVLQFVATRARAGRVRYEGEAEALWAQYPFIVIFNALTWTILLSAAGRVVRAVRSGRGQP